MNDWSWIVFDCIFIFMEDLAYLITMFHWFMISHSLAAPAPRVRRVRNLIGTSVRNGLRFFLLFGKKYKFIQNFSLQ